MPRIVTLTTDFGTGSGYVAEMKGRLLHARSAFTLVDLSHDVPPHDVRAAAWLVGQACPAFPGGSLHLVVVDPGVGTGRRLLWARLDGQDYLAPDNGVLSRVLAAGPAAGGPETTGRPRDAVRAVIMPDEASPTFHGRDVIAPTAVRLLDGEGPAALGPVIDEAVRLEWPQPRRVAGEVVGEVIHVDHFGNLVTNLPESLGAKLFQAGSIRVGDRTVSTVVRTYGDARPGSVVALVGSQGYLEVAVVEGRADLALSAGRGTAVTLRTDPPG
jgi:S-adenosylmethionine hydrolase